MALIVDFFKSMTSGTEDLCSFILDMIRVYFSKYLYYDSNTHCAYSDTSKVHEFDSYYCILINL